MSGNVFGWHSLMVSRHIILDGPRDCALGDHPTDRHLGVAGTRPVGLAKPTRETTGTPGGGVGLELGGNGPGHALASRPTSRLRVFHPMAAVALAMGLGFRLWRGMVRADNRLASPLLFGRGNRDPGTADLPTYPVECRASARRSQPGPDPSPAHPICSGSSWTPSERIRMSMYGYQTAGRHPSSSRGRRRESRSRWRARRHPGHYLRT